MPYDPNYYIIGLSDMATACLLSKLPSDEYIIPLEHLPHAIYVYLTMLMMDFF
jgi:hypothetical protein